MGLEGVSPVDIARMFQPSTLNVSRPAATAESEVILKILDNGSKSVNRLRSNHVGNNSSPQLKFI